MRANGGEKREVGKTGQKNRTNSGDKVKEKK